MLAEAQVARTPHSNCKQDIAETHRHSDSGAQPRCETATAPLATAEAEAATAGAEAATAGEPGVIVLDVRNDYEWDAGHFAGAGRPQEVSQAALQLLVQLWSS